ncbi:family 2 encapsulin nanocompartment cargo protein polyprenyl transferase [Saccharomonospora sp. NPDC006951]
MLDTTAKGPGATARVPPQAARHARDVLTRCRSIVDPQLRSAVATLPPPIRNTSGYHLGWQDEHGTAVAASGGKTLRAALVLLAAGAVGGEATAAVPGAVAVELVHNFSLLHDDVMDGDTTRRHRPTAWSVFGSDAAILAGNSMLALAFEVLATSGGPSAVDAVTTLNNAVQELMAGQSADLEFESRNDVSLDECVRMAEHKTGALLGCACALGALAGGGEPDQVALLRRFGERIGLAFQIVDDLLGVWGDESVTGKPAFSDLRNRKKSLPAVRALTSGTEEGAELAALYARERPPSGSDLPRAAALIEAAGGRQWCLLRAGSLLEEALSDLTMAASSATARSELTALAKLVTSRDH